MRKSDNNISVKLARIVYGKHGVSRAVMVALMSLVSLSVESQESWTMRQCVTYALEHNHDVRCAELELDSYKARQTGAVGRFLPYVSADVSAQYNFGRAINPETNGYTDVSTFYNSYSLSASLPVFDGFSRLHALRAAKAGVLMGRHSLRQRQDETALSVLRSFVNVAYHEGLVRMAEEKAEETRLLLRQTRVMEEIGRKSAVDVAQMESQQAEADYEWTRQKSLLASALLELKKDMAYPIDDTLMIDFSRGGDLFASSSDISLSDIGTADDIEYNAELLASRYQMQISRHEWRQARASLFPSISLSTGVGTTYYHTLHSDAGQSFREQFKNNKGEYVAATLSIPLFNRLQTITSIRCARTSFKMAEEAHAQKRTELEKLRREAWQDWLSYQKQAAQMAKKVEADSLTYQLTRRQYETGLSTSIDLRSTSAQLLNSRATLLQCRLMTKVKEQLVRYYRGETIMEDESLRVSR